MLPSPKNLLTDYAPRTGTVGTTPGGWFDLDDWVGPRHPSKRPDIAKLEGILANSGDYSLERTQGPTGYWGLSLDDGIRKYQKRNGLKVDGVLRPGGPTIEHMRKNFGALLDGHTPPTPDDIDAHHEIVGDDNPGTIAWQDPPATFANVANLPEVDQETDASNARLARGMAKSGNFRSYAQLFARTIQDSGLSGVAAVNDVIQKFDATNPGKGGQLASAVQSELPEETLKAFGIVRPEAPPKGTKVAVTDIVGDGLLALGGLLGMGAMATKASNDATKIPGKPDDFKLPGFTPADNENKPKQNPPPAVLDVPIQTGGPAPEPVKPIQLPNIPPATKEQQEIFTGEFGKEFAQVLPAIIYEDGEQDNRGTDETVTGNNIIAQACTKRAGMSPLAGLIKHKHGASRDGKGKEYLKEKTVSTKDVSESPFRRSDIAYTLEKDGSVISETHINSASTHADGSLATREIKPIQDMAKAVGEKFVRAMRKFKKGDDEQEYFDEAFKVCDEAMTEMERDYADKFGEPQ